MKKIREKNFRGGRRAEKVLSEAKKSRAAQKVGREKVALREPNGKKTYKLVLNVTKEAGCRHWREAP